MSRILGFAAVLAVSLLASAALGQQSYWMNPNGGNYSDGSNWSLGSAGQYPTFNLGSTGYTVTTQSGNGAQQLIVENDNVTLNLNSNTYTNGAIYVAAPETGETGSLTVVGPGAIEQPPEEAVVSIGSSDGSSTGTLTVNGATIEQQNLGSSIFAQNLIVENGGLIKQDGMSGEGDAITVGNLTENDGTISSGANYAVLAGNVTLQNGSLFTAGGLDGAVDVYGSLTVDNSLIASGNDIDFASIAQLMVTDGGMVGSNQDLTLGGSTTILSGDIGAPTNMYFGNAVTLQLDQPPEGSQIGTSGTAYLSGALTLQLQNGFVPTLGEQFQILKFAEVSGTFTSIDLPQLPNGDTFDTRDLYVNGTITVVPEPLSFGLCFGAGTFLCLRRRKRI